MGEAETSPLIEPQRLVNGDSKEHLSEHHNANNTIAPPFAQVNGISGGERKIPPNGLVNNFNASDIVEIQQHNFSVRSAVYRAVKKPGRNFNGVFHELSRLRGPVDIRKTIVMDVINECLRFKRRILADLVKDFMNNLAGSAEIL